MQHPDQIISKLKKFTLSVDSVTVLVIAGLCLLNFIVYLPSLNGYFLADDFMHIAYLSRVFHGYPMLLLTNFYSNWMQAANTEFYRPLISLSLAWDYLFWQNNAIGYHLTNLLFHICSTILLFLLIRKMTVCFDTNTSTTVSTMTATLFAVYPLHPEVVSWIIGRVDSLATIFYLAAFWLSLKSQEHKPKQTVLISHNLTCMSLACFLLSIFSKEIAVTLPASLWLWFFMFGNAETSVWRRMVLALKKSLPYWLLLGLYLIIRNASLGTIYGGYLGSVGSALNVSLWNRFLSVSSFAKLAMPFNDALFSARHWLRLVLKILYFLMSIEFIARMLSKQFPRVAWKLIIFAFLWFVICLLPTYQVFDITPELQGSRLIYLASAPICLLLSLVIVPLTVANYTQNSSDYSADKWRVVKDFFEKLPVILSFSIFLVFGIATYLNNIPWREASDELKQLQSALLDESAKIGAGREILLLNMPHDYKGAHMLYNGTTLSLLCSPVLTGRNSSPRIITFEPALFGESDLLNYARFMRFLALKQRYVIVAWKEDPSAFSHRWSLVELDFSDMRNKIKRESQSTSQALREKPDGSLDIDKPTIDCLEFSGIECKQLAHLNISTVNAGLIELTAKVYQSDRAQKEINNIWLQLKWFASDTDSVHQSGSIIKSLICDGQAHKYLFNLSEHKSWLLSENVNRFRILTPKGPYRVEIENIRFLNPALVIPQLGTDYKLSPYEDEAGVYHLTHKQGFYVRYDATRIKGAQAIVYEISKPNYWFEHEDQSFNCGHLSNNIQLRRRLPELKGEFTIAGKDLGTGFFEIHLAAVDKTGTVIGFTSYPLSGQVGSP
jgi:protein O-mannosyl-transferase